MKLLGEYVQRGGPEIIQGKKLIFGINRHRAWQIVKECAEKASLPKLVIPRREECTMFRLIDLETPLLSWQSNEMILGMLQEHLGHASFNTTARYRKIAGEEHLRWYDWLWISGNSDQSEEPAR